MNTSSGQVLATIIPTMPTMLMANWPIPVTYPLLPYRTIWLALHSREQQIQDQPWLQREFYESQGYKESPVWKN